MADFVLIAGTTQGPAGWERLIRALGSHGHRAVAVDLPSSDDLGVDDYVAVAAGQVPSDVDGPIVVAHSGSGSLLPAVARELGAGHQVWLAAFVPDGERSLLEQVTAAPSEVFNAEWIGQDPTTDPVLAAYFLFHDCDLEALQWALGTVRTFAPTRLYTEPTELAPEIPSTYVVAEQDRTLRPDWCRAAAHERLGAAAMGIRAGHCPHVSRPAAIAELLDSLTDAA